VPRRVAIVYNEPERSRYDRCGEEKAVLGVLDSVSAVLRSLEETGDRVVLLPLASPWQEAREKLAALDADVVFNLFEGFCGRPETEPLVPEFLEELGVPFTGCPAESLRLALNKADLKLALIAAGIPTPAFQTLTPDTLGKFGLRFPCIVKPAGEDASHGITAASFVEDLTALERQVGAIVGSYGGEALVEDFAGGREFNATVLGDSRSTVLPASEIVYSLPPGVPRLLTFAAKWEPDSPEYRGTQVVCPAGLDELEAESLAATAWTAFRLTGCRGYARVDMRYNGKRGLNVIEVNPNPDISPDAGAARQARAAGMTYTGFIAKIVDMALEKEQYARKNTRDARRGQARAHADTGKHARI
jgi:D-alanine-D-alanine ligase